MTTDKVFEVAMIARTNDQAQAQAHQRQHSVFHMANEEAFEVTVIA